jgi:hypothetical protein
VAGGFCNCASGYGAAVGGGYGNWAGNTTDAVMGGLQNCAIGTDSFVSGGYHTHATGYRATNLGSYASTASGARSVTMGPYRTAAGDYQAAFYIAKDSGYFAISHPDPSKNKTHLLFHSFVESPSAGDNLYRYAITTCNCQASICLPDYFKYLNEYEQVWVTPKNHFGNAYGIIDETQSCVNFTSDTDGEYIVLIMGTRKDSFAKHYWNGVERYKTSILG